MSDLHYMIDEVFYTTQLDRLGIEEEISDLRLTYYIFSPEVTSTYQTAYGVRNLEEFLFESRLMRDIGLLDQKINIDFIRTYDPSLSDVTFAQVDRLSSNIVGYASTSSTYNRDTMEIVTVEIGEYPFDYGTVIHEFGHTLGLSHPYDLGSNPAFTTDETIMSYNAGKNGWGFSFTDLDINVLQLLWGVENMPNTRILQIGSNSSETIYGVGSGFTDLVHGKQGNDDIYSYDGPDKIRGGGGDDEVHAGPGNDTIFGDLGSDQLYGGFGLNVFQSEMDNSVDTLYIKCDQQALKALNERTDKRPNDGGPDLITELDVDDKIVIQGFGSGNLSFSHVELLDNASTVISGIGIYAGTSLEAIYIGSHLDLSEISLITTHQF